MGPAWLDSWPHAVVGALIALVVTWRARELPAVVAPALGVGVAATAELAWEIGEYTLRYRGDLRATAYWDTVADLAATLAGAVVGAAVATVAAGDRSSPQR